MRIINVTDDDFCDAGLMRMLSSYGELETPRRVSR